MASERDGELAAGQRRPAHAYDSLGIALGVGLAVAALPMEWRPAERFVYGLLTAVIFLGLFGLFPGVPDRIMEAFGSRMFTLVLVGLVIAALVWVRANPSLPEDVQADASTAGTSEPPAAERSSASRTPRPTRLTPTTAAGEQPLPPANESASGRWTRFWNGSWYTPLALARWAYDDKVPEDAGWLRSLLWFLRAVGAAFLLAIDVFLTVAFGIAGIVGMVVGPGPAYWLVIPGLLLSPFIVVLFMRAVFG